MDLQHNFGEGEQKSEDMGTLSTPKNMHLRIKANWKWKTVLSMDKITVKFASLQKSITLLLFKTIFKGAW